MPANDLPCFIDCEASSFRRDSYPLAVAWSLPDGHIERLLIDPSPIPHWQDWDPAAEAIHGLDRERLRRNGWHPAYVAERLREDLLGRDVYSDAAAFDEHWLRRLFQAVDQDLPMQIHEVEDLLVEHMRRDGEMVYETVLRYQALQEEVLGRSSGHHDPGYDVGRLIALWRRSQGRAVKMNHGAGPLPRTSDTGTFMPVKLRGRSH
ncbi:MAG: hypothetical protein ACOCXA_01770 [Planctomycetota bacterium]